MSSAECTLGRPLLGRPPPQKHPPDLMDENPEDKRTRSGKKRLSNGSLKRKRSGVEEDGGNNTRKKMGLDTEEPISVQLEALKKFLGDKIESSVQTVADKLSATEADLALHKATTQTELQAIHVSISAINARFDQPQSNTGYAAAVRTTPGTVSYTHLTLPTILLV